MTSRVVPWQRNHFEEVNRLALNNVGIPNRVWTWIDLEESCSMNSQFYSAWESRRNVVERFDDDDKYMKVIRFRCKHRQLHLAHGSLWLAVELSGWANYLSCCWSVTIWKNNLQTFIVLKWIKGITTFDNYQTLTLTDLVWHAWPYTATHDGSCNPKLSR